MEHRIQFVSDGNVLGGTLRIPGGDPPYPACLLLGGSGPQLRDGSFDYSRKDYFPNPLFRRPLLEIEARSLEDLGVASLRYDKRGSGESGGDIAHASFFDLLGDAKTAFRYLMETPELDPARIGVIGQSEGAIVGLLLASQTPEAAFFVCQSGFVDSIEHLGRLQQDAIAKMPPQAAAEMKSVAPYFYWEALSQAEIFNAVREGEETITIGDSNWSLELGLGYYRDLMGLDLEREISQIHSPILIVHGEADDTVPVENAHRAEAAITAAGNPDITLRVLPGIGHSLNRVRQTKYPEPPPPEVFPDMETIEIIANWISARLVPKVSKG